MSADLTVDTTRLRQAAGHLDEAVTDLRRADDRPAVAPFGSTAFGTSGAAVEAAGNLVRTLQWGAECAQALAQRASQLADGLRAAATGFDATESAIAGGPR